MSPEIRSPLSEGLIPGMASKHSWDRATLGTAGSRVPPEKTRGSEHRLAKAQAAAQRTAPAQHTKAQRQLARVQPQPRRLA